MHATFDPLTGCRATDKTARTARVALFVSCIFAVACGGAEAPPAERAAPASTPSGPRVFFVQPQDGAMVMYAGRCVSFSS